MVFMVSCVNSANSRWICCPDIFQNTKLLKHLKGRMLVILTVKKRTKTGKHNLNKKKSGKTSHMIWKTSVQRSSVQIKRRQKLYFKKECKRKNLFFYIVHYTGKHTLKERRISSEGEHWELITFFFCLDTGLVRWHFPNSLKCFVPAFILKILNGHTKITLHFNSQTAENKYLPSKPHRILRSILG